MAAHAYTIPDWAPTQTTVSDTPNSGRQVMLPTNPDDFHPLPRHDEADSESDHEPEVSSSRPPLPTASIPTRRPSRLRSMSNSLGWRPRPKSAVFGTTTADDLAAPLADMVLDNARRASNGEWHAGSHSNNESAAIDIDEDGKGKGKVRGMIRRASVSLKRAVSRRSSIATSTGEEHEHAVRRFLRSAHGHLRSPSLDIHNREEQPQQPQPRQKRGPPVSFRTPRYTSDQESARPSTSHSSTWRRLRQATSFRRSSGNLFETADNSRNSAFFTSPVPGNGGAPPIIPRNTGGAARAAAADAAINADVLRSMTPAEWAVNLAKGSNGLGSSNPNHPHYSLTHSNDGESGIGIAVTATESESERDKTDSRLDLAQHASGTYTMDRQRLSGGLTRAGSATGSVQMADGIPRVDFIAHLPLELALEVLSYLDYTDLATAERVSSPWRHVTGHSYIWRKSFLRSMTSTFATGGQVKPGAGLGVPPVRPENNWKDIYRARVELDRRWKTGNASPVYLNGHTDSIYCLQFDESKIITGSRDKTIRVWDMHTLSCRYVIGPPDIVREQNVLCDANGQPTHFATTEASPRANPSFPATLTFPNHHNASILCLQYDDRILVTGSSDSTCIVHSITSGYRPVRRLLHHSAAVLDLVFDDRYIVTCSKDVSICVWDRETGELLRQLRGHAGPVNAVQMRGDTIVSCSGDFKVKLWNISTGTCIREFAGHTKGLACSQFSEDGRYVASAGNDRTIRVWDANTGECVREVAAHTNLVRSLHIDSVSGRLVSGSYDTDIMVFDMETGRQLLHFPRWHASWVLSAKSDYRRIISTGQDPKILVMDFGKGVPGIEALESCDQRDSGRIGYI